MIYVFAVTIGWPDGVSTAHGSESGSREDRGVLRFLDEEVSGGFLACFAFHESFRLKFV